MSLTKYYIILTYRLILPAPDHFWTGTRSHIGKDETILNEFEDTLKCDLHPMSCTQPYFSFSSSFVREAAAATTVSHRHPPSSSFVCFTVSDLHHRRQSSSRHGQLLKSEKEPSSKKSRYSVMPTGYFYP